MPIHILKMLRESVPVLSCPQRKKRREKIRRKIKNIRLYRNVVDTVQYNSISFWLSKIIYSMY